MCLLFAVMQAPHPLYKPSNELVPCKDPLCASLQRSDDYICESPHQCDYVVEYADGGSSYGVLVRDILPFNFTSGLTHAPRLAIGLVLVGKEEWNCLWNPED